MKTQKIIGLLLGISTFGFISAIGINSVFGQSRERYFGPNYLDDSYAQYPLFDADSYLEYNPDVKKACARIQNDYMKSLCAMDHYLSDGLRECRTASRYFNPRWYLKQNPDVMNSTKGNCVKAAEHWWIKGRDEGRRGIGTNPLYSGE